MKNFSHIYTLMLSVFLFNVATLSAQQTNSIESGYINFDKLVGLQNTSLYQGRLYTEKYRTINDRKQFFKSTQFLNGEIWYKGQPYFNQLLKYDVYEDELLLKLEGKGNTLRLSKKEIDSFSVEKNHFINLKSKKITALGLNGYYEVLLQDHMFALYAKHKKKITERKDKKNVYHEFTDTKTKYLLLYRGEYHNLNSKKDILRVSPNHKTQINKLYKGVKNKNIKDSDALMIMVVKQLESVL